MMRRIAVTLALFFCLTVSTFAGERYPATITRIVDGDTLRVWDGEAEYPVRLLGIDTPEARSNQKAATDATEWGVTVDAIIDCGRRAHAFVVAVAPPGIAVGLVADGEDAYGRTLAYVYLPDGRCLNEIILRAGCALAPERYRHARRGEFAEIERGAREQGRGFWKTIWKNL
jgi:micrococcal nuclease